MVSHEYTPVADEPSPSMRLYVTVADPETTDPLAAERP